jgi:hypothetical protein
MKTKRRHAKNTLPDLSTLKIKPHWYNELHKPITITGHKMPYGIQAKVVHEGIEYEGTLYPSIQEGGIK